MIVKESKSNSMKVRCWTIHLHQNKTASTKMFALLAASLFLVLLLFWVSVVVISVTIRTESNINTLMKKNPNFNILSKV